MTNVGGNGKPVYRRVLLKLSGEAFGASTSESIHADTLYLIASQIKEVAEAGVQIACVIGGGNIWRGRAAGSAMDRSTADYMGMLATVINGLALQDALENIGVTTRVQTAISMHQVAEPYIRRRAIRHLEKGRVVIFAGGTGNPYFTTDTTAALRAVEISADVILKGTQVDGVYSDDPRTNPKAKRLTQLTAMEAIRKRLGVMDTTAFSLCLDNQLPVVVFNLYHKGNIRRVLAG